MTHSTNQRSTVTRIVVFLLTVLLLGSIIVTLGGTPAMALSSNVSEPYPQTPGSTSNMTIVTTAERGDAITQNGIKRARVNLSGATFDGSVRDITASDVHLFLNKQGGKNSKTVTAAKIQNSSRSPTLTATFNQSIPVAPGEEVVLRIDGVGNPSGGGEYPLQVAYTTPNGNTDGPISNPYRLVPANISFTDQLVGKQGKQSVTVTATNPDLGYIALYTTNEQGDPKNLVGATTASPNYHQKSYTVNISIESGQEIMAILYYETSGRSITQRKQSDFSQEDDARVLNNGQSVVASAFIDLDQPVKRIDTGSRYTTGDTLLFANGKPKTQYHLAYVDDGSAYDTILDFQTNSTGVATLNTTNLSSGKYAIVKASGSDVVSIDGDDITNPADDSIYIVNPIEDRQREQAFGNANNTGNNTTTEDSGGGGINPTLLFLGVFILLGGLGVSVYVFQTRRMD